MSVAPKILLADDDPSVRRLVATTLGPQYTILEANDGVEALDVARRERPDLVVLDLSLPRLEGTEVLLRLREDPELHLTKVIVLSAFARQAIDGADATLAKPFSPVALLRLVESLLGTAD